MKRISQLIEDKTGKLSSRKFAFIMWCGAVLTIWTWLSIEKREILNLPTEIKWIIGALGGTYIGGNYIEKKNEAPEEK